MKIKRAYFTNGVEKAIDELAREIIRFTKGTGADGGVVGLSGGVDSTTIAYLCNYAFNMYNQENLNNPLQLYGVIMPSNANREVDRQDGLRVAKNIGIESLVIPIEPIAEAFAHQILDIKGEFHRGNLYSEVRAVVLSRVAAAKNCRVMGTGNKDEDYVLGYFTKRGDGAVDNNILGNIPKRLVKDLAKHLGVSEDLVNRVPTAALWKGQTDERELGYTYEQAELIQNGFDQEYTSIQIQKITGFKKEIINDVARRHRITQHKREIPLIGELNLSYEVEK
ncbi:NAD(+) synthase [Candidatus Pacearchaeota archaeon]|nr:NAD(+) synthase [Candidatus Pacearchaeota archaeon]